MTYEEAIAVVGSGGRVRRRDWVPSGEWVHARAGKLITLCAADGEHGPYKAPKADQRATDWEEVLP